MSMDEIAWIHTVSDDDATEALRRRYSEASEVYGVDLNLIRSASLWPELVELQTRELKVYTNGNSTIPDELRELIGARVAQLQNSDYCGTLYRSMLAKRGWSDEKITHILQDLESHHLDSVDRALIHFADKITRQPRSMSADDIEVLRHIGIDDRTILEAAALTAYFNSQALFANALGVVRESRTV